MNNQWFYIRQWKQKAWERLLEHRTVRVSWKYEDIERREMLPELVTIPSGIDLTEESINDYLTSTFGWQVASWAVARRIRNEA